MNFLSPWYVGVLAAAATVPPLLLLYFLKLKRRELPIASTLLWKRAVEDLQVNSPFQRLRNNLLLILQLLILLAAIAAICEPIWSGRRGLERSIVLLIDRSASMSVDEGGQSRLALAKQEARQVIDNMTTDQKAMVIAFANRARVLTTFTDDKNELRRAVEAIAPTDTAGRLTEAMTLAEAHSTPLGERVGVDTAIVQSQYLLFTDGRLADAGEVVVQRGRLDVVRVGRRADNVGLVALDVRRSYERPERISILARVRNFGSQPAGRDVSLFIDGQLSSVRPVGILSPLGGAEQLPRLPLGGLPPEGNESNVAFELTLPTAANIEVRLSGTDALAADDRAFAVATAPKSMRVLLVTAGNYYLRRVMPAMPLEKFEICSPQEYEKAEEDRLTEDGRSRYDVVILDGHSTERLPPGNYFFFAAVPLIDNVELGKPVQNQAFLDWDETHPILRHVSLPAVNVFSWHDLKLPPQAVPLIDGPRGPVLALLQQERNQYLLCAFGIFDETRTYLNTDWVLNEGFVVFMYNALRYLGGSSTVGRQPPVAAGEAFTVAARPGRPTVTVRRPDGRSDGAPVGAGGLATYGRTEQVGIYALADAPPGEQARAVNLLDEKESFVAPNEDFRIAAGNLNAAGQAERISRPLWPQLLAALGLILLLEWVIYNKRVFI